MKDVTGNRAFDRNWGEGGGFREDNFPAEVIQSESQTPSFIQSTQTVQIMCKHQENMVKTDLN